MAGLLRNLITLLLALPRYNSQKVRALFVRPFRITPLDVGIQRLKSDRYLLLAECAQLDLIVRSGLLGRMLLGQPPAQRCAAVDAWNTGLEAA